MIGRGFLRGRAVGESGATGLDTYDLRLGDLMRGERATMGKSLLDVQRELKIKGAYIAAIEDADPSAFDTPGFIAGYVRSYARYLNMDPDWAFETFCRESGFATAHGMSAAASSPPRAGRADAAPRAEPGLGRDIFAGAPFLPARDGVLSRIEPRAVGSVVVLAALLGGLGYGGWMILREVQKVTFAPVDQPPTVVAEVEPLSAAPEAPAAEPAAEGERAVAAPSAEALDRLYRPEALDVPVLVPRDGPIAALDPATVGSELSPVVAAAAEAPVPAAPSDDVEAALALAMGAAPEPAAPSGVQVTAGPAPEVQLVAVREAWVRVRGPDGSTLFEGTLAPGEAFDVPATVEPATLRAGESGALYLTLNGVPYGPVGPAGQISNNVPLAADTIAATYARADLAEDADLAEYVAVASAAALPAGAMPAGAVLPEPATASGPAPLAD